MYVIVQFVSDSSLSFSEKGAQNDTATADRRCGRPKTDLPKMMRPPKNRYAWKWRSRGSAWHSILATTSFSGAESPITRETWFLAAASFSGVNGRIILGANGRDQTQNGSIVSKLCVDSEIKFIFESTQKPFFSISEKRKKVFCSTNQRKTKKNVASDFLFRIKGKTKKRRCTRLSIIRRWLNCSLSNYSPPAVFETETRMQLFFRVCPFFESGCNSRGLRFLLDFSIIKATYQLVQWSSRTLADFVQLGTSYRGPAVLFCFVSLTVFVVSKTADPSQKMAPRVISSLCVLSQDGLKFGWNLALESTITRELPPDLATFIEK